MVRRFAALAAVLLVAAPAAAGEMGVVQVDDPLQVELRASFKPKALAKHEQTAVALSASGRIWMKDGSQPPALREYQLRLDRHIRLDLDGVPPCSGGIRSQVRGQVPAGCRESIVGHGSVKADIRFPEAAPLVGAGEGAVYWARSDKGRPTFYFQAYFRAPVTAEVIVPFELTRLDRGRYGVEAAGSFPKIAGGAGSVTHLNLQFRKGIFTAACPVRGPLQLHQSARFLDGSRWGGTSLVSCPASS